MNLSEGFVGQKQSPFRGLLLTEGELGINPLCFALVVEVKGFATLTIYVTATRTTVVSDTAIQRTNHVTVDYVPIAVSICDPRHWTLFSLV